jgi:6-phosphogluconolactonase
VSLPPGERVAAELAASGRPVPDVVIEPDADRLTHAVAAALVARLATAQAVHSSAAVVLTGGGVGTAVLERVAALAAEPERERVDWTAVDVWWGDERFVPADDDERNEKAARRALLDPVGVPAERIHAMPASDEPFAEPEEAADWYAGQLAAAAPDGESVPRLDVLLHGRRRARRVDLPRLAGGLGRSLGGCGARLPQAAAHARESGLLRDQCGRGGLADRRGRGQG